MNASLFWFKFIPLLIIFFFFKGLLGLSLGPLPVDFFFSFGLSLIPLIQLNFWSGLSLFLIGLGKGFESPLPFYFWSFFFIFLLWLFYFFERFFKIETLYFRLAFFALTLLGKTIIEMGYFFYSLSLYSLSFSFWISLLIKSFFYTFLSFIVTLVFFKLLSKYLKIP